MLHRQQKISIHRWCLMALEDRTIPAVFTVTNLQDDGPGSLRDCIAKSNDFAGADIVDFQSGLTGTIFLATGELKFGDVLTVLGPGADRLTINGLNSHRLINTQSAANGTVISVSGLTLTGGTVADLGGAVLVGDEQVVLKDCVIRGNSAGSIGGGAIAIEFNGRLTASDCTFRNNSSTGVGGALAVFGPTAETILQRCAIVRNTGTSGGAVFSLGDLSVYDSTLSNNKTSTASGGAICFDGDAFDLSNSTLSRNSAATSGGGIALGPDEAADFVVRNCTITDNSAAAGEGGGIEISSLFASILVESTIVAGNGNALAPDIKSSSLVQLKTSALGSAVVGETIDLGGNLLVGIELGLQPLEMNGGPTKTHALSPGSPCRDKGSNANLLSNDQRGVAYSREVPDGKPDIGAYEIQPPPTVTSVVVNAGEPQRSRVTSLAVTFSQHVRVLGVPESAFAMERQSDLLAPLLSMAANDFGTTTVATLTFSGAVAVESGSLADGRYTLTIDNAKVLTADASLDGNGDGMPGDDYVLVGAPANGLFRLFGDADGNGTVNTLDFNAFRLAFGGSATIFDFDNLGGVGTADFNHFRTRFGSSV